MDEGELLHYAKRALGRACRLSEGRERFIRQLENASKRVNIMMPDEVAVLFRRAALRLRNTSNVICDQSTDDALAMVAAELDVSKDALIRQILQDWMISNMYLPLPQELKEDSKTDEAG